MITTLRASTTNLLGGTAPRNAFAPIGRCLQPLIRKIHSTSNPILKRLALPVKCASSFTYHTKPVTCLSVHPSGKMVSGSLDETIRIKDVFSGEKPQQIKKPGDGNFATSLNFFDSNRLFSAGYSNGMTELWNTQGMNYGSFSGHVAPILSAYRMRSSIHQRSMILTASEDMMIKVWTHGQTYEYSYCLYDTFPYAHSDAINAFIPCNKKRMASASLDGTIKIWNPFLTQMSGKLLKTIYAEQAVSSLLFLPRSNILVGASECSTRLDAWDLTDLTKKDLRINTFYAPQHAGGVSSLAAFPNGTIATGLVSGEILLWNPLNLRAPFLYSLTKNTPHRDMVSALVVLTDGSLVSGSFDCSIKRWTV